MIDFRPVLFLVGLSLQFVAGAMIFPALLDLATGNKEWISFILSAVITAFAGTLLSMTNRSGAGSLSVRQAFLFCAMGWAIASIFSSFPFMLSNLHLSLVDAVFEAVSGFTTTGATVLDLQTMQQASDGIFLWRALLQWIGGIGIVVMGCTMLPALRIGGMQIFRIESASPDSRITPGAPRFVLTLCTIYVGFTLVLFVALLMAGLSGLDAICHAMGTISTGGFTTRAVSIATFDNLAVEIILALGMIVGSLSFPLYVVMLHGKWKSLFRDQQARLFLTMMLAASLVSAIWLWLDYGLPTTQALRYGFFSVISIMSGTGFHAFDFSVWPTVPATILFFSMFVGGCAGSTASGIKIFRLHILAVNAVAQISRLLRPHAVVIPYYNHQPIPDSIVDSVMGFLFVYFLTFALLAMTLGLLGIDFVTALTTAVSTLANVGVSAGPMMSPGGGLSFLPDTAKWILAGAMLLGRLELFTFLVLFVPAFWKS